MRAWLLVGLGVLLEGLAFYTILKWASRLVDAAERPRPRGGDELGAVALAALVAAALVVGLFLSFVLLRLMLHGAPAAAGSTPSHRRVGRRSRQ